MCNEQPIGRSSPRRRDFYGRNSTSERTQKLQPDDYCAYRLVARRKHVGAVECASLGILHVVIIVSHSCCGRRLRARARVRSEFQIHFARAVNYSPVIPANHISTVILITSDRCLCRFPPSLQPFLARTRARVALT